MSRLWKKVPLAEAKAHPLYGVKNWLAVFAFGVLLGSLRELGSLNAEAHKAGLTITQLLAIDHPAISFAKTSILINAGIVSAIYWALLSKHPKFRIVASSLILASWPLGALAGIIFPFDGIGEALALSLLPWTISCAVWVTYLNRSKRVRVTFENEILVDLSEPIRTPTPDHSVHSSSTEVKHVATQKIAQGTLDEDAIYERIAAELEGGQVQRGLWTRLYAENAGDETRTKVAYIRDRAKRIAATEVEEAVQSTQASANFKGAPAASEAPTLADAPDAALIEAVWNGNWNTVSVLLAQGKRVTGVDCEGRTLLDLASIRKDKPMLELLRKYIPG